MAITPQLAQIKEAVRLSFASQIAGGNLVIRGGVYNCRPMRPQPHNMPDGILAYSEHAWGNAWDLYYGDRPRRYVDKVVTWLRDEDEGGRLPVGSIITYGASGSHVHIEGAPKRNPKPYTTIPPCAAGAPDPGEDDSAMIQDIQDNLNGAGFTDYQNKALATDGVWGPRTKSAHAKMVSAAAAEPINPPGTTPGMYEISGTIELAPGAP